MINRIIDWISELMNPTYVIATQHGWYMHGREGQYSSIGAEICKFETKEDAEAVLKDYVKFSEAETPMGRRFSPISVTKNLTIEPTMVHL